MRKVQSLLKLSSTTQRDRHTYDSHKERGQPQPIASSPFLAPQQPSSSTNSAGERIDLNPLIYLNHNAKPVKYIDIVDRLPSSDTSYETVISSDGDHDVVLKSKGIKPKLEQVKPLQWVAAHFRIMIELMDNGRLPPRDILEYVAYTLKICDLAENHLWGSVLLYDRAYRKLQEQYRFKWGSDSPHLATAHLRVRPPTSQPQSRSSTKIDSAKQHQKRPNLPTVCAMFNSPSGCHRKQCSYLHKCVVPNCDGDHPASAHPKN